MGTDLLQSKAFNCRVSSVLNKNARDFGKKFLFDNDDGTCWNSDQGEPQWIKVDFEDSVSLESFEIQFQGGFAGTNCFVETFDGNDPVHEQAFYPEDNNTLQTFRYSNDRHFNSIKIVFKNSSDTYGRIVIYKLKLIQNKDP